MAPRRRWQTAPSRLGAGAPPDPRAASVGTDRRHHGSQERSEMPYLRSPLTPVVPITCTLGPGQLGHRDGRPPARLFVAEPPEADKRLLPTLVNARAAGTVTQSGRTSNDLSKRLPLSGGRGTQEETTASTGSEAGAVRRQYLPAHAMLSDDYRYPALYQSQFPALNA
jgi:hypothetical protein